MTIRAQTPLSSSTSIYRLACLLVVGSAACTVSPPPEAAIHADPGRPLPGLSALHVARFDEGARVFARQFSPDEGLGPRFNENACSACHTFPTDGGTGGTSVRRISRTLEDGRCDLLPEYSGSNLRIQVTPAFAASGGRPERDLSRGTHTAIFTIPFIYGAGLLEGIPESVLRTLEDPDDSDRDGVSGRLGHDPAGRPARFGRKGDIATLDDFVDSAFRQEMGLTTHVTPDERAAGLVPGLVPHSSSGSTPHMASVDPAEEPEVSEDAFEAVADYLRFLAPLSPRPVTSPEEIEGQRLFDSLGCAACHVPSLPTMVPAAVTDHLADELGVAEVQPVVALYSDLLLHDMGAQLEGTCGPDATTREYRTEPLMGLRWRKSFLHDGRAGRVMDAILAHGGEAEGARTRFEALNRLQQESLLKFLATL